MFKVTKSKKPEGIINYQDAAIVQLVRADFFDKCYLCEEKTPRHLEVEHFFPQAFYPHQIHEWDNLICICEKCNKIRPKQINTSSDDEVLNPCVHDVEHLLELRYIPVPGSISIASTNTSAPVNNSIVLLQRIHNGVGTKSLSFIDLRKLIAEELAALEEEIYHLNTYALERVFIKKIKQRLSRRSPFFAIKKTFIRDNNPELLEHIEQ